MTSLLPSELSGRGTHLRADYLKALVEASKILNSTLDVDRLLELILDVARNQLKVDRGTVWLVDEKARELRARSSQGVDPRLLHLPFGRGLAGSVAETGGSIRVEDAYNHPGFFADFDVVSGYRTRRVLTSAIRNKTGKIIGVIELLNKVDGPFTSEDEGFLEALTVHVALALENATLHAELVHQQRLKSELALARQIQQNLLRRPPARWHRYRMGASAEACDEVGGDLYDFMAISDTAMWLIIADVSGKGVSSALVMSTLKATLRALLASVHSFERVLEQLNATIREVTGGSHYVTLFLALLSSDSRRMHYINAGHNPPLLMRADGAAEWLCDGGTVVGLLPDVRYTRAQVELGPGDLLTLYTDGLVDALNPSGEPFGVEGLSRSVAAVPPGSGPNTVMARILSSVREFSGGETAADDQTLVVIAADGGP